jgi:hypothetical protein
MNPNVNQLCLGVIGSTTHATRAQHVLSRAAIRSEVVKISSEQKSGCMYGIRISCEQRRIAEEVLMNERIPIRQWTTAPKNARKSP